MTACDNGSAPAARVLLARVHRHWGQGWGYPLVATGRLSGTTHQQTYNPFLHFLVTW